MIRLAKYLKPFALLIAAALTLVYLQAWAELSLPNLMAEIVDKGIVRGDTALIWRVGGRMLLVTFGGAVAAVIGGYFSARISMGFGRDLRSRVFSHVQNFSLREFDKIGTASLITRTTNDITQVQMVVQMSLTMVVRAPMMFLGGVMMTTSRDPRLSLTLLAVLPVILGAIAFVTKRGLPMFRAMQKKLDKLNLVLRENLTGIRVVRAFDRGDYEAARFDDANRDLTQTAVRVQRIMAVLMPIMMLTMNLISIAIIWIGSHRIDAGLLEVGGLMAFIQYSMHILMSLVMVSMIFVMLPRASASADRVNEVLESVPTIVDPPAADFSGDAKAATAAEPDEECGAAPDGSVASPAGARLEFREVTFSYPDAEAPAIRNASFEANPGEVTAIIGGTGSGKSTLVNLIPRFYDVDSGAILIDGVDVRQMTQRELRERIGLVPQKAVLFSGSVADNIRFGKGDATEDEVVHAAEVAQALEFISEMSAGFDSPIAQGGTNVSGGQKQRLAIARALVRKPDILVFDDSFSALDYRTDARLRAALREDIRDATVLIVAQRVSTVIDAERIIVLDEGQVVGNGTHKQLMETSKVYREIVLSQLTEEEVA